MIATVAAGKWKWQINDQDWTVAAAAIRNRRRSGGETEATGRQESIDGSGANVVWRQRERQDVRGSGETGRRDRRDGDGKTKMAEARHQQHKQRQRRRDIDLEEAVIWQEGRDSSDNTVETATTAVQD